MTAQSPIIQSLEQQEIEAWRVYQLHAVEGERLRKAWSEATTKLCKARLEQNRKDAAYGNRS